MELNERQQKIFDLICDNKKISVTELSKMLFVSEMTVRRDLAVMEKGGYIKRYRGGAMSVAQNGGFPITQRFLVDEKEKHILAKNAISYLKDDISIFIDSSSTSQFLIPYIKKFKNIKIITNSVCALDTAAKFNIPCFMLGGDYCEHEMCCIGFYAEQIAEKINVDIAFISTQGISQDGCITDSSFQITAVKERIIKNAGHTVFMFENSKIGKKGLYTICHKDDENTSIIYSKDDYLTD